jgi:hypothetical protein
MRQLDQAATASHSHYDRMGLRGEPSVVELHPSRGCNARPWWRLAALACSIASRLTEATDCRC